MSQSSFEINSFSLNCFHIAVHIIPVFTQVIFLFIQELFIISKMIQNIIQAKLHMMGNEASATQSFLWQFETDSSIIRDFFISITNLSSWFSCQHNVWCSSYESVCWTSRCTETGPAAVFTHWYIPMWRIVPGSLWLAKPLAAVFSTCFLGIYRRFG